MKIKTPVTVLLLILVACHQPVTNGPAQQKTTKVRVEKVGREKISLPVHSSGVVISEKEIKLSFKTGGIIEALYADNGSRVKKGELLATLNLAEIEAQVAQAKNVHEKSKRDFVRAKNLFTDSVATLEQLQNAETAMNVAASNLEIATFNLTHSKIYAPGDGVILKRLVETNEMIAPGYPVFILGTAGNRWKIRTGLADRNYVRIGEGDSAHVILDAYPGDTLQAVVSQVGEAANPLTGTYDLELDLLPTKLKLASGFVANLEIFPSKKAEYFRIPIQALVEAEGQTGYVFAITDSLTARRIKVQIFGTYETWVAVSDGLNNINELATEGSAYLEEGDKVEIVR
jgi:RND family efflux transporter MFP subunit